MHRALISCIFTFLLLIQSLLSPVPIVMASELQFDSRCFTETQCHELREKQQLPGDGFIQNELATQSCTGFAMMNRNEPVGFCSAGATIETNATFAGRGTFVDLADFIAYIFQFSFSIAIVLAVVMIIIAGIQWMSSGGNSSVISDAKKRISGAILGILLLALSYTILNTINPALVSLRSLDVYMINPIETTPEFCSDLQNNPTLYEAAENGVESLTPLNTAVQSDPTSVEQTTCGAQYYIANAGTQTCRGNLCQNPREFCTRKIQGGDITDEYECTDNFTAKITLDSISAAVTAGTNILSLGITDVVLNENWLEDNVGLHVLCVSEDQPAQAFIEPKNGRREGPIADPMTLTNARVIRGPNNTLFENAPMYYLLQIDNYKQLLSNLSCSRPGYTAHGGILRIQIDVDYTNEAIGFQWLRSDKYLYLGRAGQISPRLSNIIGTYFPRRYTYDSILEYSINSSIISEIKDYNCRSLNNESTNGIETICNEKIIQN